MTKMKKTNRLILTMASLLLCSLLFLPTGSVLAAEEVPEDYRKREFATMQDAGELEFSGDLQVETAMRDADGMILLAEDYEDPEGNFVLPEEYEYVEAKPTGLYLSGSEDAFAGATLKLMKHYNFETPATRLVLSARLMEHTKAAKVYVYIDDAAESAATMELRTRVASLFADLSDTPLVGEHTVSLRFEAECEDDSHPQAKILVQYISFQYDTVPVLYFNIDESQGTVEAMNDSPNHSVSCKGSLDIKVPKDFRSEFQEGEIADMTGLELERVRGRGNSTWENAKKPYSFKLDKKKALFGMGKNKHWVLLADYYDNSHLRNRITYYICRSLGQEYAIRCVPVEVVMNGDYYGSYLLSENVRVGEGRVEIDELTEADTEEPKLTGGYLLDMSPYDGTDERSVFETTRGVAFEADTPNFVDYESEVQKKYISDYVQKTEDAIFGEGFKDAEGVSYQDYMDLDAAVDYWWIQELSINGDAYNTDSTRLYKPRNGKLIWGPAWDFDYVAWGNLEYLESKEELTDENEGTVMEYRGFNFTISTWFDRLKEDPEFIQALKDRWLAYDAQLQELTREGGILDQYYAEQVTSKVFDFDHWGGYTTPYTEYRDEVEQLRTWIEKRRKWVNENLNKLDDLFVNVSFLMDGQIIETRRVLVGENREIQPPDAPKKDGFYFDNWYLEDGTLLEDLKYEPDDFTVTARYVNLNTVSHATEVFLVTDELWLPLDEGIYTLSHTTWPYDAEVIALSWESSDPEVVEVEDGNLIKHNVGDATITATLDLGKVNGKVKKKQVTCVVHIFDDDEEWIEGPKKITIESGDMELVVGEHRQVRLTFTPEKCIRELSFASKEESVATVDTAGVVYAESPGTATIVVRDEEGGKEKKFTVTVTNPKNRWVRIDGLWYYYDKNGNREKDAYRKGYYLTDTGEWDEKPAAAGWKQDKKGWWYSVSGSYVRSTWNKIDGVWYYFKASGYLAQNEFVNGWWLGKNYVWSYPYRAKWHRNSRGWWYGDESGWYAKNASYVIDGVKYTFDAKGYLVE